MIRTRSIIGFLGVALLLVGLASTSWRRVDVTVHLGLASVKATGGYGLRRAWGCAQAGKNEVCESGSLSGSIEDLERLQRQDLQALRLVHGLWPESARGKPLVRVRRAGMGPRGSGSLMAPPKPAQSAKTPNTASVPTIPDVSSIFETAHTVGERSLSILRRARRLGAATWWLGMLLVVVVFATGVLSLLRLRQVPRYARVLAMVVPPVMSAALLYFAASYLATVGELDSLFAGLPMLSFIGKIVVTSRVGWSVYVFGAGLICAVVSGLMARQWQGVTEPLPEAAQPGARSRLGRHRPEAALGAKQVAALLLAPGQEEAAQLDALGAYADLVERRPDEVLAAYAERRAIDLARRLGESRLEVLACERFIGAYPGHPDTPTLARAGAKVCADMLGDADRAARLRRAGG